jgi:two-component system response regulator TctD
VAGLRILLVEDNSELAALIMSGLRSSGYLADHMASAADGRHALRLGQYSLLVLDLGLPDADGLTLLRELRQANDAVPVLILTARSGVSDRVEGLRAGADDYLAKPFAFEELLARIEALQRRPRQLADTMLSIANLKLDVPNRQAFVDQEPITLNAREISVLELLLRRKGRVVPKQVFEDQLFGLSGDGSPNAVEVYVYRLRKQLVDHGATVKVHTVRGVGYLISEANA